VGKLVECVSEFAFVTIAANRCGAPFKNAVTAGTTAKKGSRQVKETQSSKSCFTLQSMML